MVPVRLEDYTFMFVTFKNVALISTMSSQFLSFFFRVNERKPFAAFKCKYIKSSKHPSDTSPGKISEFLSDLL